VHALFCSEGDIMTCCLNPLKGNKTPQSPLDLLRCKRHYIVYGVGVGEEHDQAVDAEGNAG